MKTKIFISSLLLLLHTFIGFNQEGTLDTTFNDNGTVQLALSERGDGIYAIAAQLDGKIVVGGYAHNGTDNDFALARFQADGSLDASFGMGGIQTTNLGEGRDLLTGLLLQADGKVVASGWTQQAQGSDFAVVRYLANGQLDTSFGKEGGIITDILAEDRATALALQIDGKILVGGYTANGSNYDFAVVRYLPNGSLDTDFGEAGIVTTDIDNKDDKANALLLQSDGKILLGGSTEKETGSDFILVRYKADGTLDASFGREGVVTIAIHAGTDVIYDMALQQDQKIVVVGTSFIGTTPAYALARVHPSGQLDPSFNFDGIVVEKIGLAGGAGRSLVIQSDGKMVVAGSAFNSDKKDFALARFEPDGFLDDRFGNNGQAIISLSPYNNEIFALQQQPDNKLIVAGRVSNGDNNDFAMARYLSGLETIVNLEELAIIHEETFVYPNPAIKGTTLVYSLSKETELTIALYDMQGRLLEVYFQQQKRQKGKHTETISFPDSISTGVYQLVLSTRQSSITRSIYKY